METLERTKLTDAQIADRLKSLSGWSVRDGKLEKTFQFDAYPKGPEFAVKVGRIAEELDHHPDIHIAWRKVTISVNTHSVNGISPYDFELAKRIDKI